jgi:hypothetical protein
MFDPKDNEDFLAFTKSEGHSPSNQLSQKILSSIKNDLNPSHKIVFTKLIGIQAFIGTMTLLFCPQFSLSLTNKHELFHYFHHTFGERICMVICGSIFIGSGAVLAAYILKTSEVRKIKESCILYYFSIASIALSLLMLFGVSTYLNLALYWLLGASAGGLLMFETNRVIRKKVFQY